YKNRTLSGAETGLLAYYRFDEGTGSSVADLSGHGKSGSLTNGPAWNPSTAPVRDVPAISAATTSVITSSSRSLDVLVNPNGFQTSVYFEYGLTTNYGNYLTTNSVAADTIAHGVNRILSNLAPGAKYHYRF